MTNFGCDCEELSTFILAKGEKNLYCGSEEPFLGWRTVSVKPPIYVPTPVLHFNTKDKLIYTVFAPKDDKNGSSISSVCQKDGKITVNYANNLSESFEF